MKTRPCQFVIFVLLLLPVPGAAATKSMVEKQTDSLGRYLTQLAAAPSPQLASSSGNVFTTGGLLADPYSDYKAHAIGDTVAIQIVESTTISQSGNLATERDFSHNSGVTGVGGTAA